MNSEKIIRHLKAVEWARQEAEKETQVINSLKQIKNVSKNLRDGNISTKDAINKLKDISDLIPD